MGKTAWLTWKPGDQISDVDVYINENLRVKGIHHDDVYWGLESTSCHPKGDVFKLIVKDIKDNTIFYQKEFMVENVGKKRILTAIL